MWLQRLCKQDTAKEELYTIGNATSCVTYAIWHSRLFYQRHGAAFGFYHVDRWIGGNVSVLCSSRSPSLTLAVYLRGQLKDTVQWSRVNMQGVLVRVTEEPVATIRYTLEVGVLRVAWVSYALKLTESIFAKYG